MLRAHARVSQMWGRTSLLRLKSSRKTTPSLRGNHFGSDLQIQSTKPRRNHQGWIRAKMAGIREKNRESNDAVARMFAHAFSAFGGSAPLWGNLFCLGCGSFR